MPEKPLRLSTIIRRLRALLARLEQEDFSTMAEDRALRQTIVRLYRHDTSEKGGR